MCYGCENSGLGDICWDDINRKRAARQQNYVKYVDQLVQESLIAARVRAESDRRIKLIEGYGLDLYVSGDVIAFSRVFDTAKGPKVYQYAAIKCDNGLWYLTGGSVNTPQGVTWSELVMWLVSGQYPEPWSSVRVLTVKIEEGEDD